MSSPVHKQLRTLLLNTCAAHTRLILLSLQIELAPAVLRALPGRTDGQAIPVLLLVLPVIGELSPGGDPADAVARLATVGLDAPDARARVLEVLLDVLLLVNGERQPTMPTEAGSTRIPPPPGGLSRTRLHRLVGPQGNGNGFDSEAAVVAVKRGIVRFLSAFAGELGLETFVHLVVASGDGHHVVSSEGATALKRLAGKSDYDKQEVGGSHLPFIFRDTFPPHACTIRY